jgi:hypothetical protein
VALLLMAHIRAVNRRLVFLLIGLAVLIGLNEASRLSLDTYVMPPAKSSSLENAPRPSERLVTGSAARS